MLLNSTTAVCSGRCWDPTCTSDWATACYVAGWRPAADRCHMASPFASADAFRRADVSAPSWCAAAEAAWPCGASSWAAAQLPAGRNRPLPHDVCRCPEVRRSGRYRRRLPSADAGERSRLARPSARTGQEVTRVPAPTIAQGDAGILRRSLGIREGTVVIVTREPERGGSVALVGLLMQPVEFRRCALLPSVRVRGSQPRQRAAASSSLPA